MGKLKSTKVSIIIPVYREIRYLNSALGSIASQNFDNWEAIIVLDGADVDQSFFHPFAADSRFRLCPKAHAGVSAARNYGVENADGDLIAFLDSDDLWAPDKLRAQMDHLAEHPDCRLVYCDAEYIGAGGERLGKRHRQQLDIEEFPVGECARLFCRRCYILPSTTLMYTSVFTDNGGFDEDISIGEDWEFFFRVSLQARICCVQRPLVHYRRHPESAAFRSQKQLRQRLLAGEKIFNHPKLPPDCRQFHRVTEADSYLNESTWHIRQARFTAACKYFLIGCLRSPSAATRWVKDVFRGLYFKAKRPGHEEK